MDINVYYNINEKVYSALVRGESRRRAFRKRKNFPNREVGRAPPDRRKNTSLK